MLLTRRQALALALSATALPVALRGPAFAQSAPTGTLTIYSSQHAQLTNEWAAAFTAATGVNTVIRQGTDVLLANQIIQEGGASPADVFLTENSPAMVLVEAAGRFAPLAPETLAGVPPQFRPSSGRWMGIAARTTVFAYNTTRLTEAQLPASLLDLQDASWRRRWGCAPAGADFQAIISALLELRGEAATAAWLVGLERNAVTYQGNGAAMRGVNLGEIDGAVIYHYYYFGDRAGTGENSNNVALHYFRNEDPGAFVSISGGGVLAASRNPTAAQAFIAFVTGPVGQAILRDGRSFEYPVAPGIDANPALPPLDTLGYPIVDPSLLNARRVIELLTAAGVI